MEKFDYIKAKKEGYSDEEIQSFLTSEYDFGFDIVGAKKEGYSDQEITDYFSTLELKKKASTEPTQPDLGSGGTVGASAVQSTRSETGLFAPLQVPKMFAEKTKQEIKASNLTPVELKNISDRLVQAVNKDKQEKFPLDIPAPEIKTKPIQQPKDELLSKFNQDAIVGIEDNIRLILNQDPKLKDKTRQGALSNQEQFSIIEQAISSNMKNANNGIDILNARGINTIIDQYAKDSQQVNKLGEELNAMASEMETLKKGNKIEAFNKLVPQFNDKLKEYQEQSKGLEKYKEYEPQIQEYYGYIEQFNDGINKLIDAKSKYPTLELAKKAQEAADKFYEAGEFNIAKLYSPTTAAGEVLRYLTPFTLDIVASATNSVIMSFKDLITGSLSWAGLLGETLNPSLRGKYKPSDAFVDMMDRNIVPLFMTKETRDTKFIDPNTGNINWGFYPAMKSVANNSGFTIMLALTGRVATPILTRQFAASAPNLMSSLNAANKARAWTTILPATLGTITQNRKEAERMGLEGLPAFTYTTTMSFAEGFFEQIMPAQDLLTPNIKQRLLKDFVKDYAKGNIYAVKNLGLGIAENIGKEQLEEIMVMATRNNVTALFNIIDGETEVYVPTIGEFVETMMVAGVMAGAMTAPTKLVENAQFRKVALYKMATNYEASKAVLDQINPSNKQQILEEMQVFQTQMGKLPNDVSDAKKAEIAIILNEIDQLNKQNENPDLAEPIRKANEKIIAEFEKEIYGIITDKEFDARYAEEMNNLANETIEEDPIVQEETEDTQAKITELETEIETLVSGITAKPTVTQKETVVETKKPIAEMKGESVTVNLGGKAISGIVEVDEGGKAQIFSGNQIFELPADVEYSEYVSPVRLADDVDGIEVNGEVYAEVRFEVKDNQEVALLIKEDGTLVTMRVPAIVEELKYQSALAQMEEMGEQELNEIYNTYESERQTTPTTEEGVSETDGTAPAETEQDIRLQEAIEEIDLIEQIALEQIEQAEGVSKLVEYKPKGSKEAKVYLVTKNADGSYSATVDGKKVVNKNVLAEIGKRYEATTKQEVNSLIPKLQEQTNKLKQEVENKLFGVTPKTETATTVLEPLSSVEATAKALEGLTPSTRKEKAEVLTKKAITQKDGKWIVSEAGNRKTTFDVSENDLIAEYLENKKILERTQREIDNANKNWKDNIVPKYGDIEYNKMSKEAYEASQEKARLAKSKEANLLFESYLEQRISEAYHRAKAEGVENDLTKAVEELLTPKTETDAVQKQTTSEVPIQPKAEDSGKVEEGTPEAKPESVTEEGKEEVNEKEGNLVLPKKGENTVKVGEVNAKFKDADKVVGEETTIEMPNGETRQAEYMVVELDDIMASHNEISFGNTDGFPSYNGGNANTRNYKGDDTAKARVEENAQKLKPSIVISDTATPDSGVPIISKDGIVVSGNGRAMSIKRAKKQYGDKYDAYKEALIKKAAKFGIDANKVSGMKNPILVKIDNSVTEYTPKVFDDYNKPLQKAEAPIDKAIKRSNIIRGNNMLKNKVLEIVGRYETMSDLFANKADTKLLIENLVSNEVILPQEVAEFVNKDGTLTDSGKDLVNDILIATVLNAETLRATENVKGFRNKLINSLPLLSANYGLGDYSLEQEINDAVKLQSDVAAWGNQEDFWKYINQLGVFDIVNPNTVIINRLINSGKNNFKDFVRIYNQSAGTDEMNLFGAGEVLTKQQIIDNLKKSKLNEDERKIIAGLEGIYDDAIAQRQERDAGVAKEKDERQQLEEDAKNAEQGLGDAINKLKEEKKKGGGSGALMLINPSNLKLTEAEKQVLSKLKDYVVAKLKLGAYDIKTFFEDIKKRGIEVSKDTEQKWNEWFNEIQKTAVKRGIEQETGVTKTKPTEQKRIDKAYAWGVADTFKKFNDLLDEMASDFKEMNANTDKVRKELRTAVRESKLGFTSQQASKILGIVEQTTTKNFDSKLQELQDYLKSIEAKKLEGERRQLADKVKKAINPKTYITDTGARRERSKITVEAKNALNELRKEYTDDVIDGLSAQQLTNLQEIVNDIVVNGKAEQSELQRERKSKTRELKEKIIKGNAERLGAVKEFTGTTEQAIEQLEQNKNMIVLADGTVLFGKQDAKALEGVDDSVFDGAKLYEITKKNQLIAQRLSLAQRIGEKMDLDLRTQLTLASGSLEALEAIDANMIRPAEKAISQRANDKARLITKMQELILQSERLLPKTLLDRLKGKKKRFVDFLDADSPLTLKGAQGQQLTTDNKLTNSQIVYIYNAIKHPDVLKKFYNAGFTQDNLLQIANYVKNTPALKKYADGITGIYDSYLENINAPLEHYGYETIDRQSYDKVRKLIENKGGAVAQQLLSEAKTELKQLESGLNLLQEELVELEKNGTDQQIEEKKKEISKREKAIERKKGEIETINNVSENADFLTQLYDAIYDGNIPEFIPYAPISTNSTDVSPITSMEDFASAVGNKGVTSAIAGFSIKRVAGGEIQIRDANQMFVRWVNAMTNQTAVLPFYNNAFSVFRQGGEALTQLRKLYGDKWVRNFEMNLIDFVTNQNNRAGERNSFERWIIKQEGLIMWLNARASVWQLISAPNYAVRATIDGIGKEYLKNAATPLSKEMRQAIKEIKEDGGYKERKQIGTDIVFREIESEANAGKISQMMRDLLQGGYAPSKFVDTQITVLLAGVAYYKANKDALFKEYSKTMNDADAMQKAKEEAMVKFMSETNEMQQTSEFFYKGQDEKSISKRILLGFNSVSALMNRRIIRSIQEAKLGKRSWGSVAAETAYIFGMQQMMFQLVSSGIAFALSQMGYDDDEEKRKETLGAAVSVTRKALESAMRGFGAYGAVLVAAEKLLVDVVTSVAQKANPEEDMELLVEAGKIMKENQAFFPEPKQNKKIVFDLIGNLSPAYSARIKTLEKSVGGVNRKKDKQWLESTALALQASANIPTERLFKIHKAIEDIQEKQLSGMMSVLRLLEIVSHYDLTKDDKKQSTAKQGSTESIQRENVGGSERVERIPMTR